MNTNTKRALIWAGAGATALALALGQPDPGPVATSPDVLSPAGATSPQQEPNGSSDGRYHTCGYVTEDGVTEYLDAYVARCGDTTYASDSSTTTTTQARVTTLPVTE